MPGRKPVRVTYAHKRRRVLNASKRLLSSPLEVLPPETDDLTRTQMARRMLKRSRRMALADQFEDSNVENMREHLAKRIKCTQERASNGESARLPAEAPPQDDIAFQTPFPPSQPVHEQKVVELLVTEPLSPVPVAERVMSCTRSGSLKRNGTRPQALASPFSSRPGSAASSPKNKGKGRSTRRVSRRSLLAKARTLSGVFKENTRRVSRKGSTMSLRGANKEPTRRIKHQRCPSSPSTAYMRSQFASEDWIVSPKALSRTFCNYQEILSPGGFVHSSTTFHAEQPQYCSTPAMSQSRKLSDLHRPQNRADNPLSSSPMCDDSTKTNGDVKMMDGTMLPRRQAVHLSRNSIFSSSDHFTIESFPTMNDGETIVKGSASDRDKAPAHVARQVLTHRKAVERPQAGHPLVSPFIAEYDIPLSDLPSSPAVAATIKTLDSEDVPVGEQPNDLPSISSAHRGNLVIRTHGSSNILTPASSPPKTATSCPSSPASDLVLVFRSMDICGDLDTHSDGETHRSSTFRPLQTCSHSLRDVLGLAGSTTRKSIKQMPARSRAGTIRASDFAKPGVSSSSNVRRTRSGTVVGPDSKLAAKGLGLPGLAARGAPAPRLAAVHSESEPEDESEDELLLKGAWIEDLEYLGLAMPQSRKDTEADEMNLGGLWHSLKLGPSRRLGLKRR